MKIFRVPYRWLPHTFYRNVRWIFTDIIGGLCNILHWIPVVWFDDDSDWQSLARVMQYKLQRMAEAELTSHHATATRDRKQKLICAELLRRMLTDEYFTNAGYDPETWDKLSSVCARQIVDHSQKMSDQDQRYLGLMLGKYLRNWWT
jgi:hypothetical protein